MKLTFVSNYINHHQIPVSNVLYQELGSDYTFVQTEKIEEERLQMGWQDQSGHIPYLRCFYEEPEYCQELIMQSDIVVFGGSDEEAYIAPRLEQGKVTIRYSERIYKTGQWKAISPKGLRKKYHDHIRYRKAPVYMLCAGGYVASDFHLIGAYPQKTLKWGYFPETKHYYVDNLMAEKRARWISTGKEVQILWAGRFLDWKHPEMVVLLAKQLEEWNQTQAEPVKYHIQMIGGGERQRQVEILIAENHLENIVTLRGYLKPEEVRREMEQSQIYLFTSDYQEGWGAVLNEAMNSGCAVVASHAIGAVPFLVQHGKNGLIFESERQEDLFLQVKELLLEPEKIARLGRAAYDTILHTWNAEKAAESLLTLSKDLVEQEKVTWQEQGPCSAAEPISPRKMYRHLVKEQA